MAARSNAHAPTRPEVHPYHLKIHRLQGRSKPFAIEVRPRAGVWAPFIAALPMSEKEAVEPFLMIGPRDVPTDSGMLTNCGSGASPDNSMWLMSAGNQSTPTESYYIWCMRLPTKIVFGVNGNASHQFAVNFGA